MLSGAFTVEAYRNPVSFRCRVIKFRAVNEGDRHALTEWIVNDPGHAGRISPDFFLDGNGVASVVGVEDAKGPVIFIRSEVEGETIRLHMQFSPQKKRVIQALREGFSFVKADAKKRGFKRLTFDSLSPALVRCVMEMGFKAECFMEI
jgi:hypothetical protein